MSDTSFTLLEIHLHDDLTFTANAKNTAPAIGGLFGSGGSDDADDPDDSTDADAADGPASTEAELRDDGGCCSKLGPLVALGALGLLAAAAAVALSKRDDEDLAELTDFADADEE